MNVFLIVKIKSMWNLMWQVNLVSYYFIFFIMISYKYPFKLYIIRHLDYNFQYFLIFVNDFGFV